MNEEFQLTPLSPDAGYGGTAGSAWPNGRSPAGTQYCVFRKWTRTIFVSPVLDVDEVLEWPNVTKLPLAPAYVRRRFQFARFDCATD